MMHVGIANLQWRGKRSRHSRRMCNPEFFVSGKMPTPRVHSAIMPLCHIWYRERFLKFLFRHLSSQWTVVLCQFSLLQRDGKWQYLTHCDLVTPKWRHIHDDVIKWKHFPRYWPFVRGIYPRTTASDAELWCFLWSAPWLNGWVNNRAAGDLRRQCAHNDVIVKIWVNISSGNGLLPDGTKPLPEGMLTSHQYGSVYSPENNCTASTQANMLWVWWVWKSHFWNYCHIDKGQISWHPIWKRRFVTPIQTSQWP